jgi:hypothetical protein
MLDLFKISIFVLKFSKTFINEILLCSSLPSQVSIAVIELVFFNSPINAVERPSKMHISK